MGGAMNNPLETLAGGRSVTVKLLSGEQEPVFVKLLTIREMQQYIANADDQAALAELFTGKPKGWSDTIEVESVLEVVRVGEEVNERPFVNYVSHQKARSERILRASGDGPKT